MNTGRTQGPRMNTRPKKIMPVKKSRPEAPLLALSMTLMVVACVRSVGRSVHRSHEVDVGMDMTDDPYGGAGPERTRAGRGAALEVEQVAVLIAELDRAGFLRDVEADLGGLAHEVPGARGVALTRGHHVADDARESRSSEQGDRGGD